MKQWLRECQLIGVDAESKGMDLSALRIAFSIKKTSTPTPNNAKIRVYNMASATAKKAKEEFKRIQLKAGYSGASDIIFDGNVVEARIGREETSTHLDILAGDGDQAYAFSTVNKTLASGATPKDVFDTAFQPMSCCGGSAVSLGHIDCFDPVSYPRGRVMYGMSRDFIEMLCQTGNKAWSIQDGKIQVVDHKKALPTVIVIGEDSGMVGVPEEVNEGLRVRCLLNPELSVDAQVKIESNNISEAAASANGLYRILQIDFEGDTHGHDWFADLVCVAMDGGGGTTDSEGR